MMAHKLAYVSLVLVCAALSQPAFAQRGGGGGGGGRCGGGSGGGAQSASTSNTNALSPYTQNSLADPYRQLQMQQQYAQQAMAMRQMYALQMENQLLRNQMMQLQRNMQTAEVKAPVNANGDSNVLLASKKQSTNEAKKKTRAVSQRDKKKAADAPAAVKLDADKLALNDVK